MNHRPLLLKYAAPDPELAPRIDLTGHTIVFTHVPKAGGTTLDHIMRAAAKAKGLAWRRALGTLFGQFLGGDKPETQLFIGKMSATERAACDYLTGHLLYGVHTLLPRPCFYVTLLREPARRLRSHFRFGVQRQGWNADADVESLIAAGKIVDNSQTRQLAGLADPAAPCTEAVFEAALDNLRHRYGLVGLSESFDATLKALITLLDWPDIAYSDTQVSRTPLEPGVESRIAEVVPRYFAWDLRLYAAAAARSAPWSEGLLGPVTAAPRPRDKVLLVSPTLKLGGRVATLFDRDDFAARARPGLAEHGVETRDV